MMTGAVRPIIIVPRGLSTTASPHVRVARLSTCTPPFWALVRTFQRRAIVVSRWWAAFYHPPPRKRAQRRLLGNYTGVTNNHPYHTIRRLTPSASAPLVVSCALVPGYAQHKPPCRTSIRPYLQIRINSPLIQIAYEQ